MKITLTYLFPLGLVLFLLIPSTVAAQDAKPFVGTWNGAIMAGGMEIGIIVNFSLDDSGQLQGTNDGDFTQGGMQGTFNLTKE